VVQYFGCGNFTLLRGNLGCSGKLSLEMAVQSPNANLSVATNGTHPRINLHSTPAVVAPLACSSPSASISCRVREWDRYQPPTPIDRTGFPSIIQENLLFSVTSFTELSVAVRQFEALGRQTRKEGSINATLLQIARPLLPADLVKRASTLDDVNPADANDFQIDSTWDRLETTNQTRPQTQCPSVPHQSRAKVKRCFPLSSVMLGLGLRSSN
jgi:hypothetical protein